MDLKINTLAKNPDCDSIADKNLQIFTKIISVTSIPGQRMCARGWRRGWDWCWIHHSRRAGRGWTRPGQSPCEQWQTSAPGCRPCSGRTPGSRWSPPGWSCAPAERITVISKNSNQKTSLTACILIKSKVSLVCGTHEPVLQIHVSNWIRIRGSMPLTNGSGFGSGSWIRILLFSSLTFKMPTKNEFFIKLFCAHYFLKVHLNHFSKITVKKKFKKPVGIKVFLLFLHEDRRIRIQEAQNILRIRIRISNAAMNSREHVKWAPGWYLGPRSENILTE